MDFVRSLGTNRDAYAHHKFEDEATKEAVAENNNIYVDNEDKISNKEKRDIVIAGQKQSKRRTSKLRQVENVILEKSNPLGNISSAVRNYLHVNNSKSDLHHNESTSEISIETTNKGDSKSNKIFLYCWFLQAILGIITLIVDHAYRTVDPFVYYFIVVMTLKWILTALLTLLFAFVLYIIFRLIKPKVKSNFEEYAGGMYSLISSLFIILAIPLAFKAIYCSKEMPFMSLLFIEIELVLNVIV